MKYDDASWHYGGDFPEELAPEAGSTHIGIFLAWAINNGVVGSFHAEESSETLNAVRERRMTGAEFLRNQCGEKFTSVDLNKEGNAFVQDYYDADNAPYMDDYSAPLSNELPSAYHVFDNWESYDKMAPVITARFEEWKKLKG